MIDIEEIFNKTCNLSCVTANTGAGKSTGIKKWVTNCNPLERILFVTNTYKNRDSFANDNPSFTIIRGTSELMQQNQIPQDIIDAYHQYFQNNDNPSTQVFINSIINNNPTDQNIRLRLKIVSQEIANQEKLLLDQSNKRFCMTTAKLYTNTKMCRHFIGGYIIVDEANYKLWTNPKIEDINAYSNTRTLSTNPNNEITEELIKLARDHDTNVLFMSAEKSLGYLMDNLANAFDMSVNRLDIDEWTIEPNLSVIIVNSTSKNATLRDNIKTKLNSLGYHVIANGFNQDDSVQLGDLSIDGCKGTNDLMTTDLSTIGTFPHIAIIADLMASCGVDEHEAIKLAVGDQINQALGRNTGNRSKGAKHLLILPRKLYEMGIIDTLYVRPTSDHIYDMSTITAIDSTVNNNLENPDVKGMGDLLNSSEYYLNVAVSFAHDLIEGAGTIELAVLKTDIKQFLLDQGMSKFRIKQSKIIKRVLAHGLISIYRKRLQSGGKDTIVYKWF